MTATNDSDLRLTDRDIPSLVGANKAPSLWEIYNRIKGRIAIEPIQSTRSWWRRHLFNSVLLGLQDRYGCVLTHGKTVLTQDEVQLHPVTKIQNFGRLPFRPGLTHLKLHQVSSHEILNKWKNGQGYSVPAAAAAELHPIMAHLGISRLGIVLIVDGGAEEIFVELDRSEELLAAITDAISSFKARLAFDDEPEPDYTIDGSEIEKLYQPLTDDILDLRASNSLAEVVATYERLSNERRQFGAKERDIGKRIEPLKAQIVRSLGDAKGAVLAGGLVVERSATQVLERTTKAHTRQSISVKHDEASATHSAAV